MTLLNRRMTPLTAAAVAVIACLALAPTALAAPGPLFITATQPAVPAGAAVGTGESASLTSISCTAPGWCTAGGSYRNSAGGRQAMVETEADGTWEAPQPVALPAGAMTAAKNESATITSVSCAAVEYCVAVGSYRGSGNGTLIVTQSGGFWQTGTTLPSVSGEVTGGGVLDSISCASVGNCVAVGTSTIGKGLVEPTIATETTGTWSKPTLPSLPSGDLLTEPTSLSVSCPAVGNCVVGGTDYPATGPQLPLIIAESNGHWQTGVTLGPLPGDLGDSNQVISLGAIDCAAVGQCTAVGNDNTVAGAAGFALVDSGGSFTEVGLPYPTGSAGFLTTSTDLGLDAIACADPGDCAAGGGFPTAGTPTQPDAAPMTAVEAGGDWSAPLVLAAPGDSAPATSSVATLSSLSCPAVQQCQGVGDYQTTSGAQIPMVANSVPALTVSSATLPQAQIGHPYTTQLTSSGGAGAATWSVTSGTLPIGLTLNPATGVISGTPRFVQSASFIVGVSDTGPPAQNASASLAITVSTTAPPAPRLSGLRVSPRRVSAAGRRVGHRCEAITDRNRDHHHCVRAVDLAVRSHLSVDATVRLTATRERPGREVRHGMVLRCQAPTHKNRHDRRCIRTKRVSGHVTLHLAAGTHTVHVLAELGGHALAPGTYALRLVPTAGGQTGQAVTATVTITA
ncbi:MAG TPA: Ig domain-containing protein [Solirubrobacteraceae bacterium]|nr:Ig domain-containing protein [Solirubrobacteraceae bacterium]